MIKSYLQTPQWLVKYGLDSAFIRCAFVGICTVKIKDDGHFVFLLRIWETSGALAFFALASANFSACFGVSFFAKCWQCLTNLHFTLLLHVFTVFVVRKVHILCLDICSINRFASFSSARLILTTAEKCGESLSAEFIS